MKMKLVLALLLVSGVAQAAQSVSESSYKEPSAGTTKLELTLGLGVSHINTSDPANMSLGNRTGMDIGVNAEMPIASQVSISTGLHYVQKGFGGDYKTTDSDGVVYTGTESFGFDYLEIPVLAKFSVPVSANSSISFVAGPYAAFSIGKSISGTLVTAGKETDIPLTDEDRDNASKSIASFDFGTRFGIAYENKLDQNLVFSFGVNYDLGLKGLDTTEDPALHTDMKNRALLASVGLGILI